MAAYAALVSLKHTIEQIQRHPRPPVLLDQEQVQSLTEIVVFLQEFLETCSHTRQVYDLESRIAYAAYAAEDMVETHVVDQIQHKKMSSVDFYEGLWKMIKEMDSIKKDVMEIRDSLQRTSSISYAGSSRSSSSSSSSSLVQINAVVGIEDLMQKALDKLIERKSNLQIIQVVGMGGIGKTTLARTIYEKQMVVDHFDFRAWVTVSQDYSITEIIKELVQEDAGNLSEIDEDELGLQLYQKLLGKRYLIVMDDIWDDHVWNHLKFYFPNTNESESRIIFTTRHSNLDFLPTKSHTIEMHFLDRLNSWNLLCEIVFGEEACCPQELIETGRRIAENCKGLPLSIIVIGGLLAKSRQTIRYWQDVAENFDSIVNLENSEYCLRILYMSYDSLPVHLKPCFLYMGIFGENTHIHVSNLIKLWDAEGFLKPDPGRSLEEVADKYLGELVDRNLVLVEKRNYHGKLLSCRIHNLLRDLCLREARKQKFFFVAGVHSLQIPRDILSERRICIQERRSIDLADNFDELRSSAVARSLMWELEQPNLPTVFRLLRVYAADATVGNHILPIVFRRVNLRFVNIRVDYYDFHSILHSPFSFLWNLQTLIVYCRSSCSLPSEIWRMARLRHVEIRETTELPDPPNSAVVLEILHELLQVSNFKCSDEIVTRIPNIKRLKVCYGEEFVKGSQSQDCSLHNLGRLHKLETFGLRSYYVPVNATSHWLLRLSFPHSLKKLTLEYTFLPWEDMTNKIGSLPLLEILKLKYDSFIGSEWKTVEGEFLSLKLLVIERCHELETWITEKTHFPRLKHLVLRGLQELKEIPSDIGNIDTLKSIELVDCSDSSVNSAEEIRDEQESYGNVDLQVHIPSEKEV